METVIKKSKIELVENSGIDSKIKSLDSIIKNIHIDTPWSILKKCEDMIAEVEQELKSYGRLVLYEIKVNRIKKDFEKAKQKIDIDA